MKKIIVAIIVIGAVIFGINYFKNSSSNEGNFESLLAYAPKDTAYLFGNKKPIPAEFRERQAKSISGLLDSLAKKDHQNEKSTKMLKFMRKILKSYQEDNFESFGLAKDRSAIVYGLNNYPVVRTEITSSSKFIDSINSIAKDTNSTIEWKECGAYKCIQDDTSKKFSVTLVVKSNTVALALYPANKKDEYIKHLTSKADSKNSYSIDSFNKLLSDNNFKGYSDGFIKLKPIANFVITLISEGKNVGSAEKAEFNNCIKPIANDFTDAVDSLIIGYKALDKDNLESDMIIHTNKRVADALKSIVSENKISKVAKDPAIALGLRVDAKNLSTAIMSLTNYTVSEIKKNKCNTMDGRKLLKNASGASLMLSMFGSQLSEAYFGLDKVTLNEQGKPELFKALIGAVSANPNALIGMLKAKVPRLALVNLPKDGTEVDLLKVLPKPSPKFVTSLTASLKEHTIAVNISGAKTKEFKDDKHTLLWMDMNNNKLLELFKASVKLNMAKRRNRVEKLKKMGFLKEDEYKRRILAFKKQEENGKVGMDAIMSGYPKDFETSIKIDMDDRGIIFNTKQNRIK